MYPAFIIAKKVLFFLLLATNNNNNNNNNQKKNIMMKTMNAKKATAAQLRRAAKGNSLETLKEVMQDWTVDEIDNMPTQDQSNEGGKNPLHMAAWHGSLDNLKHLVDVIGCDVNVIATGQYCYGKTPIFFAATRCRDDVVSYLLDKDAYVKIVNNKGQSFLSIASSHLSPSTIQRIQHAEQQQNNIEWQNFRITHSDTFEYGDLDPRFLDRPLRGSDNVTELAINPTTIESRKGSFARRNEIVQRLQHSNSNNINHNSCCQQQTKDQQKGQQRRKKNKKKGRRIHPAEAHLTIEEENELQLTWKSLEEEAFAAAAAAAAANTETTVESASALQQQQQLLLQAKYLIKIISLCEKQKRPWISEVATRLLSSANLVVDQLFETAINTVGTKNDGGGSDRQVYLLERVQAHVRDPSRMLMIRPERGKKFRQQPTTTNGTLTPSMLLSTDSKWIEACQAVRHLRMKTLEPTTGASSCSKGANDDGGGGCNLQLPQPPMWIDSIPQIERLQEDIATERLVAFDTEWAYDAKTETANVSTIQLAALSNDKGAEASCCFCWVVDLLSPDQHYQEKCRALVRHLFQSKLLLGFALGKDIVILQDWLTKTTPDTDGESGTGNQHDDSMATTKILPVAVDPSSCLDLQLLWSERRSDLPGLAACAKQFSSYPLSKKEQCSDWSRRPLTPSQIFYAGLDAVVLPFILAERVRM